MATRVARIKASDKHDYGQDMLEVEIKFTSGYPYAQSELKKIMRGAANGVADAIRHIPHLDIGPHNTHISVA